MVFVQGKVGNLSHGKSYRLWDSVAPTALHLGERPIPSAVRWADMLRSLLSASLFHSAQRTFVSELIWRDVIYSVLCAGLTCYAPCFSLRYFAPHSERSFQSLLGEMSSTRCCVLSWYIVHLQHFMYRISHINSGKREETYAEAWKELFILSDIFCVTMKINV